MSETQVVCNSPLFKHRKKHMHDCRFERKRQIKGRKKKAIKVEQNSWLFLELYELVDKFSISKFYLRWKISRASFNWVISQKN